MVSLSDMPPEILDHICSYLVIHARPWKHRLATSAVPALMVSEIFQQKRMLGFARKYPILYPSLPEPLAVICGHWFSREQPLDVLRRTNTHITAGSHVRRCYIAVNRPPHREGYVLNRKMPVPTGNSPEERHQVRMAADLAGVTLPAPLNAEDIEYAVCNLVLARHSNIRELGLRGDAQDLSQVGDLKRSNDGPLLPSLKSVFVRPLDEYKMIEHNDPLVLSRLELRSSHITKILSLGANVEDIFIQNFWLRLTDDIATQHLAAITLKGIDASIIDIRRLLKNARSLRSFAYLAEFRTRRDIFASNVIAELEEHCPALQTLCLKFAHGQNGALGIPSVAAAGQDAPFSLRKFKHLRNLWIENYSIINSIQERPGLVPYPINPQPRFWTSRWNEFIRELPEFVERLHFNGYIYSSYRPVPWNDESNERCV
ncbi:hypothetical protein CKAH01_14626 [Colletotrichum kahawae]|uniref:Uncharacterized protein n=1 Tax=Colletotrichum kahawae TaxID=34407 RepID=A0AAD9YLT8_COLKA|nr:hypothetical protein CKAH01_14626 [Colletotrichum kahawae]